MNQNVLLGILIPFAGTALGSGMVFFMKKEMNGRLQKLLLGFASGVMIAASVWSLLIPALDMSEESGGIAWFPAAVGFLLNGIPSHTGHSDSTSSFHGRKAGRNAGTFKKNNHACPRCDSAQYT